MQARKHARAPLHRRWILGLLLALPLLAFGASVTYEYDAAGRLKRVIYVESSTQVDFQLDDAGNRTSVANTSATGTLQFTAATASEAETAPSITVSVSRINGAYGAASVDYQTSNGTAQEGPDYTGRSGTLNWTNGETATKTITVPIIDNTVFELAETFEIQLSGVSGAALGAHASTTVTINDNETPQPGTLSLSPASYSVLEDTPSATVSVARTGGSDTAVSVQYATSNGPGVSAADYTGASGTLNWAHGDAAAKTFSVPIANDTTGEAAETINLTLSNASGAALGTSTGTLTIEDNEPGVLQFSASSHSVDEGVVSLAISVTRTNGAYGAVSVNYGTANGTGPPGSTAVAGSDYTAASGTLNWANGDGASKSFPVPITNDSALESSEAFTASLGSVSGGATLAGTNPITITIIDNDSPGVPQNLRTSPVGTSFGGSFNVLWNTATGPIHHYNLREQIISGQGTGTVNNYTILAPTTNKSMSKGGGERTWQYNVRACVSTDDSVCSVFSNTTTIDVCPSTGCN